MPVNPDDPVLLAIRALTRIFDDLDTAGVIIGGIAVSLVARERYTKDLDAMLMYDTANTQRLIDVAGRYGFAPRFSNMERSARESRIVTFQHVPTGMVVDLALGAMPLEEEIISRSQIRTHAGISVRLPTPEDLIILKAIAQRPTDLIDIRTIAEVHPDLDRTRVRYWVDQYGDLLDDPGLWARIEPLLESD